MTGVEMFQKTLDQGQAGDNVGCLLRGVERDDIERGQVLAQAGVDQAAHEVQGGGVRAVARRRAGGTRRSSRATGRSSTSAPPT